jgi:hypothetical protein
MRVLSSALGLGLAGAALSMACDWSPIPEAPAATAAPDPAALVAALRIDDYKRAIETLASFGDRRRGSASYDAAALWVEEQLTAAGYTVEHHEFTTGGRELRNSFVTKIGTTAPHEMLIVAAHLDGAGGGGGADDDASGSALVLQAALTFASPDIQTSRSIRFVFFNSEESGLAGSRAYVRDRADLQGVESPVGSGRYPEPLWVGMIQHDMLLYDHGLPPGPEQIAAADIDIEYPPSSSFASAALVLAELWQTGNRDFSSDYPAEIGDGMSNTDSVSFADRTAAISVRENRRLDEIGRGSNPHWHRTTDVYSTYSEADFRLGFNALQMTSISCRYAGSRSSTR